MQRQVAADPVSETIIVPGQAVVIRHQQDRVDQECQVREADRQFNADI